MFISNVLQHRIYILSKYCTSFWSILFARNPPTMLFHHKSSDTPGSHSLLKSHHPSNLSFIFPPPIFPSPPSWSYSGNGCSDSQLWSKSGRSYLFFSSLSLPTYTAHLRGWTWWQPPPPRCRPCSSSDPPAPSGCPQCAASRCRLMFLGTCLMHCLQSLSTAPEENREKRKCSIDEDAVGESKVKPEQNQSKCEGK